MPLISIIIPAYKNDQYLAACLDSVLSQDEDSWEAIVVVDGSPDTCAEIAQNYSARDRRITSICKIHNEGTHLARKTGALASHGDYCIFLDADDELSPRAVSVFNKLISSSPNADIIHYGQEVIPVGVNERDTKDLETQCNRALPTLRGGEICLSSFSRREDRQDWRILQRIYSGKLLRSAFNSMSNERFGRGQDAYECLAIASLATEEVFCNDSIAYRYYYGRGITTDNVMSIDSFSKQCDAYSAISRESLKWAKSLGLSYAIDSAESLSATLLESLFSDWSLRLAANDKNRALNSLIRTWDNGRCAGELYRLARDSAYAAWVSGESYSMRAEYAALYRKAIHLNRASSLTTKGEEYKRSAAGHISDLKKRSIKRNR